MATTQTNEGLQNTRQLLDELDALMNQMLALPVDEQENFDAPPEKTPTVSATLTLLEPPSLLQIPSEKIEVQHSRVAMPDAEALPQDGSMFVAARATEDAPDEPDAAMSSAWASMPPLTQVAAPAPIKTVPLPPRMATRWAPGHLSYQFLLWVNQGYDHSTIRLGNLGRILRSRRGKAFLGIGGMALFVAALTWLAKDVLSWNW